MDQSQLIAASNLLFYLTHYLPHIKDVLRTEGWVDLLQITQVYSKINSLKARHRYSCIRSIDCHIQLSCQFKLSTSRATFFSINKSIAWRNLKLSKLSSIFFFVENLSLPALDRTLHQLAKPNLGGPSVTAPGLAIVRRRSVQFAATRPNFKSS